VIGLSAGGAACATGARVLAEGQDNAVASQSLQRKFQPA